MKKLVSLMLVMALVLSMATVVNAVVETANLNVSVAKTAKIGDEVTVTVDWTEKMESVDLELGFDKTKVEFVSSSISEDYIATDRIEDGVVQISWFTANGQGITNITYKFKVKANGTAKFTTAEAILADANVESPSEYKYGTATLTIKDETTETEKPSTDTTKPETEKPSTDTTKPETEKPSTDTTKPDAEKPSTDTSKPETQKPSTDATKPETEKPSTDTTKPETQKPSTNTSKPSTDTSKKPTKIPQAGINMVQIAVVAMIVISAIVVVAYKSTKR